jgi:HEAT repeat protein
MQRGRLLASYYLLRLDGAGGASRVAWEDKLLALDTVAVPSLLDRFGSQSETRCESARVCLARLAGCWPKEDRRRAELIVSVSARFGSFSVPGKAASLQTALAALPEKMSASQLKALAALLIAAAAESDAHIHASGLALAERCMNPAAGAELNQAAQSVARSCLKDEQLETRVQAVQFLSRGGPTMLAQMVTALHDPSPEVRRAALTAVAPSEDVLSTDDLLPWLHDPDEEVRQICENALHRRGLEERHIRLARLVTDPKPTVRLQVFQKLLGNDELEPGVWLRRLSRDGSPAVRAATLRAAAEQSVIDLTDRIEQMSQNDPSPTVRQLAKFYLSSRKAR